MASLVFVIVSTYFERLDTFERIGHKIEVGNNNYFSISNAHVSISSIVHLNQYRLLLLSFVKMFIHLTVPKSTNFPTNPAIIGE